LIHCQLRKLFFITSQPGGEGHHRQGLLQHERGAV
jgi:hypothetical protein